MYFLITAWDRGNEASMPKASSICPAVSIQHRLVTDGQTDRQTQGNGAQHSVAWQTCVDDISIATMNFDAVRKKEK